MKTLLSMTLAGSAAILVVLGMRVLLRKAPKIFSYGLWAVVLFRLLCPVGIPVRLPVPAEPTPVQTETLTNIKTVEHRTAVQPEEKPIPVQKQTEEIRPVTPAQPKIHRLSPEVIVTGIWILGASVTFLAGAFQYLRFRRTLTGACRVAGNLYQADHIGSAFAVGLFRPKIYIPSDLSPSEIPYILAHEQHHIRRGDPVVRHLAFAALCLHWFNPLVWAAFVLSGKDMEMSCDEAVIRKFGESVRADYASSLLNLAMGKSILSGAPIAFGEGNTKKRIQNLIAWKPQKRSAKVLCLAVCLCATLLCACQPAPEKSVVVSKNDGSFDANIEQSASGPAEGDAPKNMRIQEQFSSTDKSVDFTFDVNLEVPTMALPVVEVAPRSIDSDDMERVARTLLGNVDFYDREPSSNPQYSKSQYQEMIMRLTEYSNLEAMTNLVGADNAADMLELFKNEISRLTDAMETAPETNLHAPCNWSLKKERFYNDTEIDIGGRVLGEDDDWLVATAEKGDLGYTYMVVVRDRNDYKLNRFNLQLGGASIDTLWDRQIYWSKLCRTGEPTQSEIQAVQEKVLNLLGKMNLGQWRIANTQVEVYGEGTEPEYMVCVHAVPVLNGVPVVYGQKNIVKANDYTGAYALTQATFLMSASGDIIDMELDSPLEVKSLITENAATLPFSQLFDRAQQHLSLSDSGNFGLPAEQLAVYEKHFEEKIVCHVNICNLEYGLARIMVKDSTDLYYYVPALMVRGNIEYCGEKSGKVYFSSADDSIVCMNAMDGSIIG